MVNNPLTQPIDANQILNPPVQSTGYLNPILLEFLNSLPDPNTYIMQSPAFQIFMQSHPNVQTSPYQNPSLATQNAATPNALTSASGLESLATAPRTDPTATTGSTPSPVAQGPLGNPQGPSNLTPTNTNPGALATGPSDVNVARGAGAVQPLPQPGPNATPPIGNTATGPRGIPDFAGSGFQNQFFGRPAQSTPAPISTQQAAQQSGVVAGPTAINHVPYGPELTGLSGYGGLITPNGTPVAMSAWQKMALDPTAISRYNSYVSDVAGMNPADLTQIGQSETANKMADLKAPIHFGPTSMAPAPGGG